MATVNLIEAFQEIKDVEKIDRPTLMKVVEEVFRSMIKKKYGSDDNFDIIINPHKGDFEIMRTRLAVKDEELEDTLTEIALSDARKWAADYQEGEEVTEPVDFSEFGRRAIWAAKLSLVSKVKDLRKEATVKKYNEFLGEIVTGEVYQVWKREVLLLDEDGNELILSKNEQIPKDFFNIGDVVRAVVKRVDMRGSTPVIILSRTSNEFLMKLMEHEVPEISDGLIAIRKVVREPGERAKVAVESFDDRIDPVGACVGMKGSRIHGIVRELKNESIDVINYTTNPQLFVQRALQISEITRMEMDEEKKHVNLYIKPEYVSMTIGRRGVNIKLACALTGYEIDVYRDEVEAGEEYDINLEEFADEIEMWIIDVLKEIGCDTAKSVLKHSPEEIERRADLEKETVEDIFRILNAEFEEKPG